MKNKTIIIKKGSLEGQAIRIDGLWQDVAGESWMMANGNPACMIYGEVKDA